MDKYVGAISILANSDLLAEATSVGIDLASNANPVKTLKKGLAGRSRGAVTNSLSVDNAVPRVGMEKNFIEMCQNDEDISLVYYIANKQYRYDGWIDSGSFKAGVDASAGFSFVVMAGPAVIT